MGHPNIQGLPQVPRSHQRGFSNLSHLVQGLEVTGPVLQMGKTEAWRSNHPRTHGQQVAELPPYTGLSKPQSACSRGATTFFD